MQIGMSVRVMNMQVTDGKKRREKNPLSLSHIRPRAVAPKRPFKVTLRCGSRTEMRVLP